MQPMYVVCLQAYAMFGVSESACHARGVSESMLCLVSFGFIEPILNVKHESLLLP